MRHWPWEHKFTPVAGQHVLCDYLGDGSGLREGIGTHETIVLMKCECGKVKTKRLSGSWSKESLDEAFSPSKGGVGE